jgi:hypothetical protein
LHCGLYIYEDKLLFIKARKNEQYGIVIEDSDLPSCKKEYMIRYGPEQIPTNHEANFKYNRAPRCCMKEQHSGKQAEHLDRVVLHLEKERDKRQTVGHINPGEAFLLTDGSQDVLEDDWVRIRMIEAELTSPIHYSEEIIRAYYTKQKDRIFNEFKRRYHHEYTGRYAQTLATLETHFIRPAEHDEHRKDS